MSGQTARKQRCLTHPQLGPLSQRGSRPSARKGGGRESGASVPTRAAAGGKPHGRIWEGIKERRRGEDRKNYQKEKKKKPESQHITHKALSPNVDYTRSWEGSAASSTSTVNRKIEYNRWGNYNHYCRREEIKNRGESEQKRRGFEVDKKAQAGRHGVPH